MEAFRSEVHSFFLRPFLDEAIARLGQPRVDAMLADLGAEERALRDRSAWVSLAFCEAFFARLLAETGDPAVFDRCGRLAMTPAYAGFSRSILRAIGTPRTAYRAIVETLTPRFNKVGRYTYESRGPTAIRLSYGPLPDGPREQSDLVCRARAAQLAAVPVMFDLPPGEVTHLDCIHRGGTRCVYDIRWAAPRPRVEPALGAVAGAAMTGLGAAALGAGAPAAAAAAALGGLAGAALGLSRRLQRALTDHGGRLADQQDELLRAVEANERRYQELVEAKAAVDRQVAERTAELRATSEKLAQTLGEVQALDRAKTDFFNNVSHDLRTPLTLIVGPLEDLQAGREPAGGAAEAIGVAHRNAKRLLGLINQLLDLARVDAGRERLALAPVDLRALAEDVARAFAADARRRRIALQVQAPDGLAPLSVDASWVESALTNLVANAMKHVPAGGHVTLHLVDEGGEVRLTVEDDGPGLSQEAQARIFERFAQAEGTRGGTGLGLAIVREAARLHGGRATVESEPGRGARFHVVLPKPLSPSTGDTGPGAEASAATSGHDDEEGAWSGPASAEPGFARASAPVRAAPDPRAPLALVVEDHDDLREHVAGVLAREYRVQTARDGEEGVALALAQRPDVVVSDVAMPRLDGYGLCRALRARDETRATPIVLLTARSGHERVLEGFEAGADDYLTKPFHARELLARVGVHVRLRRLVREMAHKERLAALGVLAASVAHEVRNPLTALTSGLGAMKRRLAPGFDPSSREMLDVLIDCAARIERITSDLLDLSRVDRADVDRFAPGRGVRSALRLVRARAPKEVSFEEEIDEETVVLGRPGDMNHVFLNLVDNALRAVGSRGTIRVCAGMDGDHYRVTVEDSGVGVPDDAIELVFQPFYTTRSAGEGTGLGLAIARQVVEQHGGSIAVGRSELGGAAFAVRIPQAVDPARVVA